jgi:L-ribulokinase
MGLCVLAGENANILAMPPDALYAIGTDFGTASARTLLLDLVSGEEVAAREVAYPHGVIDEALPGSAEPLPSDWALHHPGDYLTALEEGIAGVLAERRGAAAKVIGIGVDATSCTVLPVTAEGVPLCQLPAWERRPHAWPKLWKHHAAQPIATRLNEVALERGEPFLARYGGRISSEWYFPKLIQIWLEDREVYDAAQRFIEVTDWVVWQLCGVERRSACPAMYKAMWSPSSGLPPVAYFEAAYPRFSRPQEKLGSAFFPLGTRAGYLRPELGGRLGLPGKVAVAVGNVDSFVSFPGVGAESTGPYVMVVGTSICDMVVHTEEIPLVGITGVARDGILPGLYGYEAGQPAVGDMLGWFAERLSPGPGSVAERLVELEDAAASFAPGGTGLVALGWWNGNRSVLADADLSGVIAGFTLQTTPAEVYRALLESVAFGDKVILDGFRTSGFRLDEIIACGGIAEKSPLLMQLIADVSGLPVKVPASSQVGARGSALFGAVAAGEEAGGFSNIAKAAKALCPPTACTYPPDTKRMGGYAKIYPIWKGLHDSLGSANVAWLHELKRLKHLAEPRAN